MVFDIADDAYVDLESHYAAAMARDQRSSGTGAAGGSMGTVEFLAGLLPPAVGC